MSLGEGILRWLVLGLHQMSSPASRGFFTFLQTTTELERGFSLSLLATSKSGTLLLVANRPSPLVAEGRLNRVYWSHIFIDRSLNFYDDAQCPRCFLIAMLSFTGITSVLPISICSRSKADTAAKSLASMMAHDL